MYFIVIVLIHYLKYIINQVNYCISGMNLTLTKLRYNSDTSQIYFGKPIILIYKTSNFFNSLFVPKENLVANYSKNKE